MEYPLQGYGQRDRTSVGTGGRNTEFAHTVCADFDEIPGDSGFGMIPNVSTEGRSGRNERILTVFSVFFNQR